MYRVLITGINGYISQYLYLTRPNHLEIEGASRQIDPAFIEYINPQIKLHTLSLEDDIQLQLKNIKTDFIIHTAAMANLSECQKNPEQARQINVKATKSIAKWCAQTGTRMIYLSTDIVFDGEHAPYSEDIIPKPVNVYGKTKLQGEQAVQNSMGNFAIIRIALTLGRAKFNRINFIDWVMVKIKKGEEIPLFTDEYRTASAVKHLAQNIWTIALSDETGVFHQFGASRLSRYDIGNLICKELNSGMDLIRPVKAADMQDCPRPLDVSLTTHRTVDGKKLILPGIDEVIKEVVQ
ncbi:MAG: SDR family oxidoreductase [Calditrichaceae bacterium]|nr:SDR family oxidoreductase [Calditrichaceae bacterium]